jgi:uncharacterized SAM-binding protein YcdF (DUF218 family)
VKKFSRKFKILLSLILIFTGWFFLAPLLAKNLAVEKTLARADAIWILGGAREYQTRCRKAAELFRRGVSDKIFVVDDGAQSGWNARERRNLPFAELARRELVSEGVPENRIEIVKPAGVGTIYEARAFVENGFDNSLKSVLLVTSDYHTRRARWTFERALARNDSAVQIGVVRADGETRKTDAFFWWLSPDGWEKIGGEYVKFGYYYLFL